MHIGFVTANYIEDGRPTSGVAAVVASLVTELISLGHQVSVVTRSTYRLKSSVCVEDGATVYRLAGGAAHWYVSRLPVVGRFLGLPIREIEYSWQFAQCLRQIHQREPLEIIEVPEANIACFRLFAPLLPPIVVRLHGDEYTYLQRTPGYERLPARYRLARTLQRPMLRQAVQRISPSRTHGEEVQKEIGVSSDDGLTIVPNPIASWMTVQSSISHPVPEKMDSTRPSILYAGQLSRLKGIFELIEAISVARKKVPQVRLYCAGPIHQTLDLSVLQRLLEEDERISNIVLLGPLPWKELVGWYAHCDVFVAPSYYESFCVSAAEAMAFGKPVVASRVHGLADLVRHDETGLLVKAGDVIALGEAMAALLCDRAKRHQMGQNAKIHVVNNYSAARVAELTLAAYKSVLAY